MHGKEIQNPVAILSLILCIVFVQSTLFIFCIPFPQLSNNTKEYIEREGIFALFWHGNFWDVTINYGCKECMDNLTRMFLCMIHDGLFAILTIYHTWVFLPASRIGYGVYVLYVYFHKGTCAWDFIMADI